MPGTPIILDQIREATRIRLSRDTLHAVRAWANALHSMGSRQDRVTAHGLAVLLDMHAKLEALDAQERGQ